VVVVASVTDVDGMEVDRGVVTEIAVLEATRPEEQPATRRATIATHARSARRLANITLSMTLAVPGRFPDRTLHMPQPMA